jgi:hypothetical protein
MGPQGATGATGPAGGVTLIAQYDNISSPLTSGGDYTVTVPEILNKRTTTYVEGYWATNAHPDIWTPMADGWGTSNSNSRTCSVSWTAGQVGLWGMLAGDIYLIKVFQHN